MTYSVNNINISEIVDISDAGTDLDTSFNGFPRFLTTNASLKVDASFNYKINGEDITSLYNVHPRTSRAVLNSNGESTISVPNWATKIMIQINAKGGDGIAEQTYAAVAAVQVTVDDFKYDWHLRKARDKPGGGGVYVWQSNPQIETVTITGAGYSAGSFEEVADTSGVTFMSNAKTTITSSSTLKLKMEPTIIKFSINDSSKIEVTRGTDGSRTTTTGTDPSAQILRDARVITPLQARPNKADNDSYPSSNQILDSSSFTNGVAPAVSSYTPPTQPSSESTSFTSNNSAITNESEAIIYFYV